MTDPGRCQSNQTLWAPDVARQVDLDDEVDNF